MNTAYKHLDAKLRLAELTVWQWLGVVAGAGLAVVWGVFVSPFGTNLTLVTAIYIGALPAGAAVLSGITELNLGLLVRSAIRWRRLDGRFVAGGGDAVIGYLLYEDAVERAARAFNGQVAELDLATLWEEV